MKRIELMQICRLLHELIAYEECVIESNLPYGHKAETTTDPICREARRRIKRTQRFIGAITKAIG